jgi:hypothetical protein
MQYHTDRKGISVFVALIMSTAIWTNKASAESTDSMWSTRIDDSTTPARETIAHHSHVRPAEPDATAPLPPALVSGAAMLLGAGLRKAVRHLK